MEDAVQEEQLQGEPGSLWLASAGDTDYAALERDIEADVAVIGAGVAGLTAALELKKAGHTVVVIEAARIGTGVTGHHRQGHLTSPACLYRTSPQPQPGHRANLRPGQPGSGWPHTAAGGGGGY